MKEEHFNSNKVSVLLTIVLYVKEGYGEVKHTMKNKLKMCNIYISRKIGG